MCSSDLTGYSFQESFGNFVSGLSVFLTGVIMVFFALLLLIILIKVIGMVVERLEQKTVQQKEVAVAPAKVEPVVVAPVAAQQETVDELELVAVITAAIAASLGTTTDQLVVRSLRKVNRRTR